VSKTAQNAVEMLTYSQLYEAWWTINDGYSWCADEKAKRYLIRIAFESLLEQGGWTVARWNDINKTKKRP